MAATISEQSEHNENPANAGFLLSGDTTGVFARCIAPVPLSHRRFTGGAKNSWLQFIFRELFFMYTMLNIMWLDLI